MEIKEMFNRLSEREKNLDLLPEADSLRKHCTESGNEEYYYRCTNLLLTIFINAGLPDDALKLASEMFREIDKEKDKPEYRDIYKTLLDNLAYIYITGQDYRRALHIDNLKRNYIDPKNKEEVNRWLLECAYIHEAIGEKSYALQKLEAILLNEPTDNVRAVALSDIIKLYIDAGDFTEAEKKLKECKDFVLKINDAEGIRYCAYLEGKILRLRKEYKKSYNVLNHLIDDIEVLDSENFNYLNEYLCLLCDSEQTAEGIAVAEKFMAKAEATSDPENKLIFYKSCLRLDFARNRKKKGKLFDSDLLLDKISSLEKEIIANKDIITTGIRENEFNIETTDLEKSLTGKILDGLDVLDFGEKDSLRSFLFAYSKTIVGRVPVDEIRYLIFDRSVSTVLPLLPSGNDNVSVFQFRNGRLYERTVGYKNIEGTAAEEIITAGKAFALDFSKGNCPFRDVLNGENHADSNFKYLTAVPLKKDGDLLGCVICLSRYHDLTATYPFFFLKLSSRLLELHLTNLLYSENSRLEKELSMAAGKELGYGLFRYNTVTKKLILPVGTADLLGLSPETDIEKFTEAVVKGDLEEYSRKYRSMKDRLNYTISYHLKLAGETVLFRERGIPLEYRGNLYYVGTIDKTDIAEALAALEKERLQDEEALKKTLESYKEKKFAGLIFAFPDAGKRKEEIFLLLRKVYKLPVYFYDELFAVLFPDATLKEVSAGIKLFKKIYKNIGYRYTVLVYPRNLIRTDDFIGFSKYLFQTGVSDADDPSAISFTNEIYAKYISVITIASCVSKAIIEDSAELTARCVTLGDQLVGYYVTPDIRGVYGESSLKVLTPSLRERLDEYIVDKLGAVDYIAVYALSLSSLAGILVKNGLPEGAKIVFEITEGTNPLLINPVIARLAGTKCRLIVSEKFLCNISLANLKRNGSVIFGFRGDISLELTETVKPYLTGYYFGCDGERENCFKIGKTTIKLNDPKHNDGRKNEGV